MALIDDKEIQREEFKRKNQARLDNMDYVQYPLRIPTKLHRLFKQKLAENNQTMREVLVAHIKRYIEKQ